MRSSALATGIFFVSVSIATAASAATLQVGPGKPWATPCAAIAAASAGDTIEIDAAGDYAGDVCYWATDGLTLKGVNGRPVIDAAGNSSQGKAIWVIGGDDTVIENVELTGATVPDQNGAGIRQEGKNLTVRGSYFHDNENGILAGNVAGSEILIERSEFANNGFGDGLSHNLYINHVAKLTFRYNYSHDANEGHLLKSRAAVNHVLYNRLSQEGGSGSYEIDLPNGGTSFVIGNVVQQGPNSANSNMLSYGAEGPDPANPGMDLFVVNNTFVNEKGSGFFVRVGDQVAVPAVVKNNVFVGSPSVVSQPSAALEANFTDADGDPMFVDPASLDYHLSPGSPCEDAGVDPGTGAGQPLTPDQHYVHPANHEGRAAVGAIDVGAYEIGGGQGGQGGGSPGGGGGGAPGTGGTGGANAGGDGGDAAGGQGGGGGSPDDDADGGCGCRAAGSSPEDVGIAAALSLALAAIARRRRRAG